MNKLIRYTVLFFLFAILFACASRKDGLLPQKEDKTLSSQTNVDLLQYPFYSGFTSYATITEPALIRRVLSQVIESDLNVNLFSSKIQAIHVNSIGEYFIVYIRVAFDNVINKQNILDLANMKQESETDRFWSIEAPRFGTLYFDLVFRDTIVLTNIDIITYEALEFDWIPQDYTLSLVDIDDTDFWLWSSDINVASSFSFEQNVRPEWGFLSTKGQDPEGYVITSVVIPFSGERQDKATIKLILPSILRNFEVKDNATLPFIDTVENVLLVDGIYISPANLSNYLMNVIKAGAQTGTQTGTQ